MNPWRWIPLCNHRIFVHFTCAHCVELHEAESEHCESEFEFEFCDRYDNPESTPLSICGVFESFFPLESDFIEPPPSLTTFEFITLNENITTLISVSVTLSEVVSEAWSSGTDLDTDCCPNSCLCPPISGGYWMIILDSVSKWSEALGQKSFYNGIVFLMRTLCQSQIWKSKN